MRLTTLFFVATLPACGTKVVLGETGFIDTADGIVADSSDTGDTAPVDTAPVDTGPTEEELDAIWGDARLVVSSPSSGDFLPLGEAAHFEATVVNADGDVLPFEEITWSSDVDSAWELTGENVDDASLAVGTHALTAEARLPNGDRLANTVGGILVQAEDAGIYTGDVMVDVTVEYDGTPYTVSCIGSTTIIVDPYGELASGDSSCTIALFGYDTEAAQIIDLEVSAGALSGDVDLDLSFLSYGFDAAGTIGDGELEASWTDDVYGYAEVAGSLAATRVSRDTELSE